MEQLGLRKAEMTDMSPDGKGRVRIDFIIPSRGLIGFQTEFMTLTSGSGCYITRSITTVRTKAVTSVT